MDVGNVIILRGLPGAGKSTLSDLLTGGNNDLVCEADNYMVNKDGEYEFNPKKLGYAHGRCMSKFKGLVNKGEPLIVVSNTSTKLGEFKSYKAYAEENGYRVTCTIVENRHGNVSVHDVPEESMEIMRERFQVQL